MSVKEKISHIIDFWFMYEPLFFNVYCTHKLEENNEMECKFRTGKRRIEYNSKLLIHSSEKIIENLLRTEIYRILLKHPYQRVPRYPNRSALTTASDITISEHCSKELGLKNAHYYNLSNYLSYEEYYKKLYYICPMNASNTKYESKESASELWDEDGEVCDSINTQIENAQKNNQWGSVSASLQETILASVKIPMDYRRILSQFRATIVGKRRKLTRMKPNRRYGFEFMGSKFEPKTHLLVAIDVSGSISHDDLNNYISIINRFFSYGVELINVISFDTEIKQQMELKKTVKSIKIIGRGGTNFQCAIDYYESQPEYQGMIIFTDGFAEVPKVKLNKDILWILTGKYEYDIASNWIKKLKRNKATWIPSVKSAK